MAFKIALIHDAKFPVIKYGGTERIIWWLAKGLSELGHQVRLYCRPDSSCPFAQVFPFSPKAYKDAALECDVLHFFHTPEEEPITPYLVTIEGNGQPGERFLKNTVFVSRNHAERHGSTAFVYNGVDPQDYIYSDHGKKDLLFLAKASWNVKNVNGAIQIARESGKKLNILGGSRWWLPKWKGITWRGMMGGIEKSQWLAGSEGLIFPVLWNEPFGIAIVEAFVSGTPVLGTPFGSLPELISPQVGRICSNYQEFYESVKNLGEFKPKDCRDWALSQFHYLEMTRKYLSCYEKVSSGGFLNTNFPTAASNLEKIPFWLSDT